MLNDGMMQVQNMNFFLFRNRLNKKKNQVTNFSDFIFWVIQKNTVAEIFLNAVEREPVLTKSPKSRSMRSPGAQPRWGMQGGEPENIFLRGPWAPHAFGLRTQVRTGSHSTAFKEFSAAVFYSITRKIEIGKI